MHSLRSRFVASALLLALAACASPPPPPPAPVVPVVPERDVRFVVLHVNDVHGQVLPRKATWIDRQNPPPVGGLSRAAAYVNQVREEAIRDGFELLVLDAGDWYQGTPEGIVANGFEFVTAFSKIGFDAMCVGNHEFDRGVPNVLRLLRIAGVPAVCANLRPKGAKERVDWVEPWRIVERAGIKIALVGLLTPVTPEITHKDALTLDFGDPREELARVERELAGRADWILPVTHLGIETDKELARAFPELPLVVGGHSHTLLKEGAAVGETLVVQAGTKLSVVGRVELLVRVPATDAADRRVRVVEKRARLVDLLEEPQESHRNLEVDERCATLVDMTRKTMEETVGELAQAATRTKDPLRSGSAGNLLADLLRERAEADVGFMNRGGIRLDIDAGPVTRREVFEIMPFDNSLVTLSLKGADLFEFVRRSVEGTAHSGLEVSGLVIEAAVDAAGKRTLRGLRVGGAALEPERVYQVAMNSFMADGGDAYLDKGREVARKDTGLLIREVLEDALTTKGTLTPATDNRYEVVKP